MKQYVFLALALAGCRHGETSAPDDQSNGSAQIKYDLVTVQVTPPHWTDDVPARIVFDETRTSRIGSPLGGRISAVMAELGDRVKAGAPLVTVISGDLADLRNARDKAVVDLDAAKQNYDRVAALVEVNSLPRKELLNVQQELAEAQVALSNAEQKLASLKVQHGGETSFTITAPREGIVVDKHVAVGQQVSPDSGAVLAIADLAAVWLVADLLEDAVDDIRAGSKVEIQLDGAGQPLDGTVDQVSAIVDPDRHTVPTRIRLANPAGLLRPNALARVRFFEEHTGTLSVPADAILTDGARSYVYVVKNGTARRQNVIAGPRNASIVPIRSGLAAGDQIVAHGAVLLENQLSLDDQASSP